MIKKLDFPSWDALYRDSNVEELPWYNKNLDQDLQNELKSRKLSNGSFLDLGTGPGTQAIQLAKFGFDVTATDISQHAIEKARKLSNDIKFIVDDVLDSRLEENRFNYILDRGCFHTISQSDWKSYLKTVKSILKKDGILFLKTFSKKEPGTIGPRRFSPDEVIDIFSNDFIIQSIKESVYDGTLPENPKSLFIVMKKR